MRLLFILLFAATAFAQMPYDIGDWISYTDFHYARAVDAGTHEVFIATSGGILEYELYRQRWDDPIVVGYGLSAPVALDDPQLLLYDEQTYYLWVATRTQLLQYDVNAQLWRRIAENLWGPGDRVVNLGVGGNSIYVETVPAALYSNSFYAGSPLPNNNWLGYTTRYKGSRNFGSMLLDVEQTLPDGIRWRGLRSRVPLTTNDLYGSLGSPPANFPTILLPGGWIWNSDGTVLDPYLRAAPLTDWIVDGMGHFWATYWGAGTLLYDLRGGQPQFYAPGLAGNDVRAIFIGKHDLWFGGINSGGRKGITHASDDFQNWKLFETRDNSRIRSTDVLDIAEWNGDYWFATDDGLLDYQDKDQSWRLYNVNEHLQSDQIVALAASDSELWIGTTDGLAVMTLPDRMIFRINNQAALLTQITRLALCGDTLYVGTALGLYKGATKDRAFAFSNLDPSIVNALVTDISVIKSEIWIATQAGIEMYDQATGQSKSFVLSWLGGNYPTTIYAASTFVWVGTSNGFYRFKRATGEWISYTTADGLVNNQVQDIEGFGDDLLIGTAAGLTRFYWNRPDRPR
jgi:hypothetical protein